MYVPWSAELVFGYEGRSCPAAMIVRSAGAEGTSGDLTVDVSTDQNGTTLTATDGGARHTVYAAAPEPADSFGDGGVRSFFDRMEIFGEPSTWQVRDAHRPVTAPVRAPQATVPSRAEPSGAPPEASRAATGTVAAPMATASPSSSQSSMEVCPYG